MTLQNWLKATVFAATTTLSGMAIAADEVNVSTGLTAAGVPLAFRGMDTVALATGAGLQTGAAAYTATVNGAAYYFASEQAKAKFEADPDAYLAQFGGFCAFGMSKGKKFDGNPTFSDIRDGKLYVFVNAAVFELYQQDPATVIAQAEANWPNVRSVPANEL